MSERKETYVNNFSRMIRFETVSEEGNVNPEKFRKFHEVLRELFPNIFAACEFMDFEGSILLKWKGNGSADKLPVMFMNHMDVVSAEGEWLHDPFAAEVADGAIWGRGTVDTKCGLWAMLQAADELAAEGFVPDRDIYFESACTEETFGEGAIAISQWMIDNGIRLDMTFDEGGMVMYDPIGGAKGTFAMVGVGEKGCSNIRFIARSEGGHASTPGRNTPLVRLGKFMSYVDRHNVFDREMSPTIREMFRRIAPYMGKVGKVIGSPEKYEFVLNNILPKLSNTAGALIKTTLAFTMAKGAESSNALPTEAWIVGNMRSSHHQGEKGSLKALSRIAARYDIEIDVFDPAVESRLTDFNGEAFRLVEQAVKATLPNVDEVVPYIMTGASDSRFYDRVCDQCIRFLPFTITEQQMESIHGLNENIGVDTLEPAVDWYKFMMKRV